MKLKVDNWDITDTIKSSKAVWCCIIATEILLMLVCFLIYHNKTSVELSFTQDDLIYESGESGFYLDRSYDHLYIACPEFTLPKGFYTVEVEYDRSDNRLATAIEVQYAKEQYDTQYVEKTYNNALSGRIIPVGPHNTSSVFRVKNDNLPMQVRGYLTEEWEEVPYILIRNIHIVSSPVTVRYSLFSLMVIFIMADILFLFYRIKDRIRLDNESKNHIKMLIILIFISCIPLMVDYLFKANDLRFHLTRIEALKEGLLNGVFPVKIQPVWLSGHGYAASVCYGDLFLYIPAIIHIFGVSLQASYKFYVFLVNTATVLIAYHSFRGMSNAKTGLVCTMVYTLNIYRLFSIYTRASVGEYTAMVFAPLLLYGLWKAYMLPEDSKEHGKSWIAISAGCCGIFFSHMITTVLAAFFIVISALILWKKTFRRKTLFVLVKAMAATVLLSCWFLVPFLDYMINESFAINGSGGYEILTMEDRGVFLAQFFMIGHSAAASTQSLLNGAMNERPYTVGMAALSALVVWFYMCFWRKDEEKSERKTEYLAVFLCFLSLFMATWMFPYTWLVTKFPLLEQSILNLQFPWRSLSIAGIMFVYLLCLILKKNWVTESKKNVYIGVLVGLSLFQGLSYMSKCLDEYSPYRVYQSGNLSTYDTGGGEYFPTGSASRGFTDELTLYSGAIVVTEWHRDNGAVEVSLTNYGAEPEQMDVPFLLYKGYHAIDGNGEELPISKGASGRISVSVPAGFDGSVKVEFKEPWYWRMSELISLIMLLCLLLYPYVKKQALMRQQRSAAGLG